MGLGWWRDWIRVGGVQVGVEVGFGGDVAALVGAMAIYPLLPGVLLQDHHWLGAGHLQPCSHCDDIRAPELAIGLPPVADGGSCVAGPGL